MNEWIGSGDKVAPCRTTACIAGHAMLLVAMAEDPKTEWSELAREFRRQENRGTVSVGNRAQRYLDLDDDSADRLFFVKNWPKNFREAYIALDTRKRGQDQYDMKVIINTKENRRKAAVIVAKRMEHFIKTKGRE